VGEVYAGFFCGYGMALLSTPILAFTLLRMRAGNGVLARLLPEGTSAIGLAVILHGGLFITWTGLGLILGLVLLAMDGGGAALGSPNGPFTLFVFGLILAIAAPAIVLLRSVRHLMIACALSAILCFGWLMPYLARWSNFD
jgi:hypothetical protein